MPANKHALALRTSVTLVTLLVCYYAKFVNHKIRKFLIDSVWQLCVFILKLIVKERVKDICVSTCNMKSVLCC